MTAREQTRICAIVGPTAGGKTALSLAMADQLRGEIVCCDSMQVYRGMDVGTAKPTPDERAVVPHHMLDVCDAGQSFSLAEYVTGAKSVIAEIHARGRLPILCGGTGLYLDGVLFGGSFEQTGNDGTVRARLMALSEQPGGAQALYERLQAVDAESAAVIHPNNVKRVIRALEIYESCGVPKSELDRASRQAGMCYDACVLGLRYHDRDTLYRRIDVRVDMMLQAGLYGEVQRLLEQGIFDSNTTAAQAIGYKELLGVLRGECSREQAEQQLKTATRHYAKRQMTWFSAKPYVNWIYADDQAGQMRPFSDILAQAMDIWRAFVSDHK